MRTHSKCLCFYSSDMIYDSCCGAQFFIFHFFSKLAMQHFKSTLIEYLRQHTDQMSWCNSVHNLWQLMMIIFSNVYVQSDDNIYMQCGKLLRCQELIGHQRIVFSLLKQLEKTADSVPIKQQIQYIFGSFPHLSFLVYIPLTQLEELSIPNLFLIISYKFLRTSPRFVVLPTQNMCGVG